jgi:hypothetical protein
LTLAAAQHTTGAQQQGQSANQMAHEQKMTSSTVRIEINRKIISKSEFDRELGTSAFAMKRCLVDCDE